MKLQGPGVRAATQSLQVEGSESKVKASSETVVQNAKYLGVLRSSKRVSLNFLGLD